MTPSPLILGFSLPSGFEYIVILVVALLIFGAKLPSVMRGLGGSIKQFKKGMSEEDPPPPPKQLPSDAAPRERADEHGSQERK